MKIRKHIRFYGSVQGVGFRYHAEYAANSVGASGWVRNEYDGSVSMEIQGTPEQTDSVLSMLGKGRYIQIDYMEVKETEPDEGERGFRVLY